MYEGWQATRLALLACLFCVSGCGGKPPTDRDLINRFQKQRQSFQLLHEAICRLAPQTVWINSNNSQPMLAANKRDELLPMMSAIGATRVASLRHKGGSCETQFMVWSTGMLDSGDDRTIVYDPALGPDDLIVRDLNSVDLKATVHHFGSPSSHGHRRYARRIDGSWWITRDYWE